MISIITTINSPTKAVKELATKANVIVIGDKKTPQDWKHEGCYFYNLESQNNLEYSLKHYLPENHYARKNIGYLIAIKSGTDVIYDSDDDTYPNENWKKRDRYCLSKIIDKKGWVNIHGAFNQVGWPRGYSLREIFNQAIFDADHEQNYSSIQQGMINGDPDVDAIWRLTRKDEIKFEEIKSYSLSNGGWCPFNSQSTWWFPRAFALMYLPITASFRMTDIWRSFIAQRCLWEINEGVTFHSPAESFQKRNEHDLLHDFKEEVDGYLNNDEIISTLSKIQLKQGDEFVCENLLTCYQSLADKNIINESEIRSVMAWIKDYQSIR